MLSKNKLQQLSSLQNKKFRNQFCEFLIEGDKIIEVLALSSWIDQNFELRKIHPSIPFTPISGKDLERISSLKTPNQVVARLQIENFAYRHDWALKGITVFLDGIQDPGNAGTIIRTADWYGVEQVVLSYDAVDKYHPKLIQACMGSLFRVSLLQYPYWEFKALTMEIPWWGATLDGDSIRNNLPEKPGILVLGNESSGIRMEIMDLLDRKIKIPGHPNSRTESLNVAVATGIILDKMTFS
jgi:TrmH family RNA methyltransferase